MLKEKIMDIAYRELLALKNALPPGGAVGHASIMSYHKILKSAEKRTGHNLAQFSIDAPYAVRDNPQSPKESLCGKKVFLQEMERALAYMSQHVST
jgi:fructose-specific component phosphotransferase system IIB-like protein